jgi:hypothetical protein
MINYNIIEQLMPEGINYKIIYKHKGQLDDILYKIIFPDGMAGFRVRKGEYHPTHNFTIGDGASINHIKTLLYEKLYTEELIELSCELEKI